MVKAEDMIPTPPMRGPLYVPIDFWLEIISYADKRVESIAVGSGYGSIEMSLKIHKGKIHEVNFGEHIRVRDIIGKSGSVGNPNSNQESISNNESMPVGDTE